MKKKRKYKSLFLAPHQDDETLFGAYTIMREKPLVIVCTDSYTQEERGDEITNKERIAETKKAMKLVGVDVEFLHIPDNNCSSEKLVTGLDKYYADTIYAPAVEDGGNPTHNLVGSIASLMFLNVKHYMTYGSANYTKTKGNKLIIPTQKEMNLKAKMLACYPSQMKISCRNFFTNKDVLNYESFE